jgi:hypothetical protein
MIDIGSTKISGDTEVRQNNKLKIDFFIII